MIYNLFSNDTNRIMVVLKYAKTAKPRNVRIVNRYTPADLKRIAREAYQENPTIENLAAWNQAVKACKVTR